MTWLEGVFWLSALGVIYAYAGYAVLVRALVAAFGRPAHGTWPAQAPPPTVSMLIPVHNERAVIETKVRNVRDLEYPADRLEVIFLCDGCTDGTVEYLASQQDGRIVAVDLPRKGKAAALNRGLDRARGEIVVFSDASIMLEPGALAAIVRPFAAPEIGCVSGEDLIGAASGEGLYGRYELSLRRLESRLCSIVGASGSFYAQRRALCEPFTPTLAPDFLSVLRTVDRGYRAISEPAARGVMSHVADANEEFGRKVRTILRGITTLAHYAHLLNPFRFGWFAFELTSHKLFRWLVPLFLLAMLGSSAVLATRSPFYAIAAAGQALFYGLAALSLWMPGPIGASVPGRVSLYFTAANVATASAWLKFMAGSRQELWSPSQR